MIQPTSKSPMSATILDYWDPDENDSPTMVLRYFYLDAEAQLAALELRQAQIPSFITHSNSQTILPMGQGWIGLHIRRRDFELAVSVLKAADMWEEQSSTSNGQPSGYSWQWIVVAFILLLTVIIGAIITYS